MLKKWWIALFALSFFWACHSLKPLTLPPDAPAWKVKRLEAESPMPEGNPEAGLDYLIYGDYIGSGVPLEYMRKVIQDYQDTVLNRSAPAGEFPYMFNTFEAPNGEPVVSGNCFTCHASRLNGEMVLGLGAAFGDFQQNNKLEATLLNFFVRMKYKKKSPEYQAFDDFGHYYKAIAPKVITKNPGVNPAFRLEEACVNYRDPVDLTYRKKPNFKTMRYTLASDVPPLWNLKKKNALYYNGMGRGSFDKLLMQASVLGIPDSTMARKVLDRFADVVAWAAAIEPPVYPGPVNTRLATQGEQLFLDNCSKCHGTYGDEETYPNKLVSIEVVKTDPYYARYFTRASGLADWYNESWFAQTKPASRLEPSEGYVAPPLDGIWATAPYLHNGSVPTLDELLNSSGRPTYWEQPEDSKQYDYEKVGWKYKEAKKGRGKKVYDTTLPGYSNQGHYFGDVLNDYERRALLEYLKTL